MANPNVKNERLTSKTRVPTIKRHTLEEMRARREKNLCFNCGELFHIGHKWKKLYLILGENTEDELKDTLKLEVRGTDQTEPHVSLNAVAKQFHFDTIKLLGKSTNQNLVILLDSGSTHSFLDPKMAEKLGCTIEYTHPWLVTIADGNKVDCKSMCPQFTWEMGGHIFSTPVRLLRLGGCDVVIGVDLLAQFGKVILDFKDRTVQFKVKGKEIKLHGI